MIFCPHIDTLYRFLSICIIYAYLSYMCTDFTRHRPPCCEGENRSLYLVTQTTAARGESQGRWREQEHTVGKRPGCQRFKQSCRKKKHLLITVSTPESIMVFIVAVFIWGPTVWVLEWSKLTNPPRSNWVYKAAVYSCGIKPLDCKKALLMAGSWAPTKAPFVKIPAKQRWCIVSGPPNNRADDYFLTTLLAALTRWLITLWYGK